MHNNTIDNSPIIIVGTPRSGTTLTAKILGRHSHIFMPGETHFFGEIYSRKKRNSTDCSAQEKREAIERLLTIYGRYNEPPDQARVELLCRDRGFEQKLLESPADYRQLLDVFMETQMLHEKKKRWGNNVPRDIFHVQEILSFYPNAKIIVCVRDIRDFLLSYSGKWRATSPEHVERLKKLYHPVVTSLLWKSSMKLLPEMINMVPARNLHILKYENLVTDPDKEVKKICSLIEEDFELEMLQVNSANSSAGTKAEGIFSSSVGRWKKNLLAEDAYIAQRIARKELLELGYSQEKLDINCGKVWFKLLSTPKSLLHALYANKDSRGPLLPYLHARIKSIIS